jgi:hypothetical protein
VFKLIYKMFSHLALPNLVRVSAYTFALAFFFLVAIWFNGGTCISSLSESSLLVRFNERFLMDEPLARKNYAVNGVTLCSIENSLVGAVIWHSTEASCQISTSVEGKTFQGRRYSASRCGFISYLFSFSEQT